MNAGVEARRGRSGPRPALHDRDGGRARDRPQGALAGRADEGASRAHREAQPTLNAFIRLDAEAALEAAQAAEAEAMAGRLRGPLHGMPVGIKDIIDVAGLPTTCHSKILQDNVATADAVCVSKLRAAGAIVVGKLSTHEFAIGGPSFDLPWPPARNPWNPDHHPGGSSSGSGSGVAAGLFPMALGTDTGGSVRNPGELLRHRRHEADLRPGVAARRLPALLHARPCRADDAHGRGQCADAGDDRRPRSARSRQRRRAERPLSRRARSRREGPAHRLRAPLPRDRHAGRAGGDGGARARHAHPADAGRRRARRAPAVAGRVLGGQPRDPAERGLVDPSRVAAASGRATTASWRAAG